MIVTVIGIFAGFLLLWKGGNWLVEGATTLAKGWGVSPLVIGLTVVAFGTSAPELCVNITAAFHGEAALVFSNVLGSNLSNSLLILGLLGLVCPFTLPRVSYRFDLPVGLAAHGLLAILIFSSPTGLLSRGSATVLLAAFTLFLWALFRYPVAASPVSEDASSWTKRKALIAVVAGCLLLPIGGRLVSQSAITLATLWGVSEMLIGTLIVAVGTSLPELVTSIQAGMRQQADLAVGNIMGSNLFNSLFVLGVSAWVHPSRLPTAMWLEIIAMIGVYVLIIGLFLFGRYRYLSRFKSMILILLYVMYISMVMIRG